MKAQRRIALALLAVLTVAPLAACSSRGADAGSTSEPEQATPAGQEGEQQGGESQIANPIIDCESAYDASKIAGFSVTFPEAVPGYSNRAYQAVEGEFIQCVYSEGDQRVFIRKGKGSDDISGDYNEYSSTKDVTVEQLKLKEKGDGTLVHVVIWQKDGYSFAIMADAGLEPQVAEGLAVATM